MEWLLLALLLPVLIIPIVLLFGFAGCDLVFGLHPVADPGLVNVTAVARRTAVLLSWEDTQPAAGTTYRVERTEALQSPVLLDSPVTTFEDSNLTESTTYSYRVQAIRGGTESPFTDPITATTTSFGPAFSETLTLDTTLVGDCAIQRIEPAQLFKSGAEVRITIASGAAGPLQIDRLFISQPDPQGDNVYDAAADLTLVAENIAVPANSTLALAPVLYAFDQTRPLLIAADVSATAGLGNARRRGNVPPAEGTLFRRDNSTQASLRNRTPDFVASPQIVIVTLIEVA